MKKIKPFLIVLLLSYNLIVLGNCPENQASKTPELPELTTNYPTDVTMTSATLGGNVTSDGGTQVTARGVVWSTNPNPTVSDNKTNDGTGSGEFTSYLKNLESNTKYYVRAYATNSVATAYGNSVIVKTHYGTATDIDGNTYGTVKIGEQIWMAENLKVTKFNDGTSIHLGDDEASWPPIYGDDDEYLDTAAYCWYKNDISYKDPYGAFYNKYAVDKGNLCPSGWHISRGSEWGYLINFLGGNDVAGGKLKEAGTEHWQNPNRYATNEVGFRALPAGMNEVGATTPLGNYAYWWGFSTSGGGFLHYLNSSANLDYGDKVPFYRSGYPVRCVYGGDLSEPILPTVKTNRAIFIMENSAFIDRQIVNGGGAPLTSSGTVWSTSPNPTVEDNQGGFIIKGLEPNTKYYARAYATNAAGTSYGEEISFITTSSLIDVDDNIYPTVKMGSQTWMAENLRTEHLNDGTEISLIESNTDWSAADSPGYCWYNNDESTYKIPYGAIYNTFTVNTQKVCPSGWEVPNDDDWSTLVDFFGGKDIAGGYLKEHGTTHWQRPNIGAKFNTGFVALPGGYRTNYDGSFTDIGKNGNWWSSDKISEENQRYWYLIHGAKYIKNGEYNATGGFSIRCIKRETSNYTIPELTSNYPKDVDMTSVTLGGNITSDGGTPVTARGIVWSTNPNPTVSDNKTNDGTGSGKFTSYLDTLESNTKYYVRAYATNSVGTAYGNEVIVKTHYGTVADIDGNTYGTVKIGGQIWMAENLRVTHLNNGTSIPLGEESSIWRSDTTEGYRWYDNDTTYKDPYGAYYTKYTANTGRLCPSGWHVSNYSDWKSLINYLGGNEVAGGKLKEAGTEHWLSPNNGATNEVGFNALPAGVISISGEDSDFGSGAYFSGFDWYLTTYEPGIISIGKGIQYVSGFPVRCVYGEESYAIPQLTTKYPKDVDMTSATLGGNITSDGGSSISKRGVVWSTSPNPTIADNKTLDSTGSGEFISELTGLDSDTKYYVRAYATNSIGTAYGNEVIVKTHYGTVTDIDGNTYGTVKIGEQVWMAENLKVTRLNNGNTLPLISDKNQWSNTTLNGYCWYNNDELTYKNTYGAIYRYSSDDICPVGWRIPNILDWDWLNQYLVDTIAGKLKEAGNEYWSETNIGASNETGFTALPGGFRNGDGNFLGNEKGAYFWGRPALFYHYSALYFVASNLGKLEPTIPYKIDLPGGSIRCILGDGDAPNVITKSISSVSETSVRCDGEIINDGGTLILNKGFVWSTNQNPTISDNKIEVFDEGKKYASNISGLQSNTTYYIRSYATNYFGTTYGEEKVFKTHYGSVTDIDGNTYGTIKIGDQIWMAENLKVEHFNDGTEIPLLTSENGWASYDSVAYCWYDNNKEDYKDPYGALYNAFSINTNKLCPSGWHVPSQDEWQILFNNLGGASVAGGKLKEAGLLHWSSPNTNATNEISFYGLPGGYRQSDGKFNNMGNYGNWWSSSNMDDNNWYPYLSYDSELVKNNVYNKRGGFSVRCIEGDCQINLDLGDPVSLCSGEEETLDAGSGFDNYKWSTGATTQSIKVSKSGNYSVTVTDGNGCTETDMITVTVNTAPNANAGADVAIGSCAGQSATLDATGSTGTGLSYSWDNAATLSNANIANPMASPSVSTVYTVTITDSNGCTDTDAMTVTVEAAPVADAGVDAAIEICTTQSITLDATESMGTKLTYVWDNEGTLSNNKIPNPVASPAVTTTYKVTVTDVYGCMDNDAVKVTVNTNTDLNVEIDGNVEACFGEASTLDAGSGFESYKWSTGETARTIEVTTSGDYSVTVTNGDCEGSDAVTVTFNSIPQVNLVETITACAGEIETLDAGSGFDSYKWSTGETTQSINVSESGIYWVKVWKGDCFVIDEIEVIFNSKPNVELGESITSCVGESEILDAGSGFDSYKWSTGETARAIEVTTSGDYSVTVTNGDCEGSDAVTVTFNSIPQVNLGETITACAGETETLDAGSGFDSYKWSTGETTQSINVSESGTYWVKVWKGDCFVIDEIEVIFNSKPNVELGESITSCVGESEILDAGSGFDSYKWSTGETTRTIEVTISGDYSVTVTNGDCEGSDAVTVTFNSIPQVNLGETITACAGETETLDAGSGFDSYKWSTGETTQTIEVTESGVYSVTVTQASCEASEEVMVMFHSSPIIDLGNDTSIFTTDILELTPGSGYVAYKWNDGSTGESYIIQNEIEGLHEYSVEVTDINSCKDSDTIFVTVKLVNSISAYMDNGLVKIYPNPTKGFVYIKSEKAIESNVLISVYDLSGQLLLKKEFDRLKENYNYEIDLSKYKSGMFLFHVIDDSGTVEFSVVKY